MWHCMFYFYRLLHCSIYFQCCVAFEFHFNKILLHIFKQRHFLKSLEIFHGIVQWESIYRFRLRMETFVPHTVKASNHRISDSRILLLILLILPKEGVILVTVIDTICIHDTGVSTIE